jgi:hypothetical protein
MGDVEKLALCIGVVALITLLLLLVVSKSGHDRWLAEMRHGCEARGLTLHNMGGKGTYACRDEKTGLIYSRRP